MATSNRRDVELGIAVETAGAEEITKLAADIRALAATGGDAAPEFLRLADAIDKIAAQTKAVSALADLRTEVEKLSASQVEAASKAGLLEAQYKDLTAAAKASASAAEAAKASEAGAKAVYDEKRLALKLLKLQTDDAKKGTDEYKASVKALEEVVTQSEAAYRKTQGASREAAAASKAAAAAERGLRDEYKASQVTLEAANTALKARTVVLEASDKSLRDAGVATENLGAVQQALVNELRRATTEAQRFQAGVVSLARAQAELSAQDDFDKVSAQLRKLRESADLDKVAVELGKVEKAEKDLVAQSKLAAAALDNAFSATGIRSAATIRAEIDKVNAALLTLSRDARVSGADFDRAFAAGQEKVKQLNTELSKTPGQIEKAGAATTFLKDSLRQLAAIYGGVELGTKFFEAATQVETLRRTLTLVTGSTQEAGRQIEFLRDTANQTGQSFGMLAQEFSTFTAATVGSGMALKESNELFKATTTAAGQLGLSTQRTSLIITALSQIASKGKVSLEELQGQLGESLPGALALTAKGLGVTTTDLTKLVETGKLAARDFFPAFKRGMEETFGTDSAKRVEGLAAAYNRVKNALTEMSQSAADTGPFRALTSALESVARNFDLITTTVYSAGKAYVAFKAIDIARTFFGIKQSTDLAIASKVKDVEATVAQTAATTRATGAIVAETEALVANTAATRAAAASKGFLAASGVAVTTGFAKTVEGVQAASGKLGGFISMLGGPYVAAATVAISFSEQIGKGLAYVAAKATGAIDTLEKNEAALLKMAKAEEEAAKQAKARAEAVTKSFVQLQVEYAKQVEAADNSLKVAEKLTKAKKDEGEASKSLAELTGKEVVIKAAAVKAAADNELAIRSQLSAQRDELVVLEKERAALAEAAGAQSTWDATRKEFFRDLDAQIEKKRADVEVTKQQAAQTSAVAAAAALAAEKYKDNASRVAELREAVDDAKKSYDFMVKALKEGLTTQDAVDKSARQLAATQGLLEDAYDDATKAIQRRGQALREQANLQQQDIEIARTRANVDQKLATLTGQYTDKVQASIAAKGLDIKQSQLKISTADKEVALMREEIAVKQQQLDINDPLYEQKKREIDAMINAAAAKTKEGLIERENLRGLNTELGILDGTLYQGAAGFMTLGNAAETAAKQMDKAAESSKRASTAIAGDKAWSSDFNKGGYGEGSYTMNDVATQMAPGMVAADSTIRKNDGSWGVYNQGRNGSPSSGGKSGSSPFGGGNTAAWRASKTVNVNLSLGGKTSTLSTSQSEADKLLQMIQDAQRASGTGP